MPLALMAAMTCALLADPPPAAQAKVERVAFLNMGPPSNAPEGLRDMLGVDIRAEVLCEAAPLLEQDGVTIVVLRVHSGGGYWQEVEKIHRVLREDYKAKFRTVVWGDLAINAAVQAFWTLPEWYATPEASIGGSTIWIPANAPPLGEEFERLMKTMDAASIEGQRDPLVMRSLMTDAPLSAIIGRDGDVRFFDDENGPFVVKRAGRVLTLNAEMASRLNLVRGIADDRDELLKQMGVPQWAHAGEEAEKLVHQRMVESAERQHRLDATQIRFSVTIAGVKELRGERREAELGRARVLLGRLEKLHRDYPYLDGPPEEWYVTAHQSIQDLEIGPRDKTTPK